MCSTPFGINESNTGPVDPTGKITSPMCSTPFGINESNTRKRLAKYDRSIVLNAFRHQRIKHTTCAGFCAPDAECSTPFGINESNTLFAGGCGMIPTQCSTPFGINESNTIPRRRPLPRHQVLNAFRHQRIKHRYHRLHECTIQYVLNAFRHQRIKHRYDRMQPLESGLCSTPFGINESNTPTAANKRDAVQLCSTPFGINESNTMSASAAEPRQLACSTPFGINESNTSHRLATLLRLCCAQRLSASTNQTLARYYDTFPSGSMCSTPFGINESNTAKIAASRTLTRRCSTPFGINESNTKLRTAQNCSLESAQRLSASTNQTPIDVDSTDCLFRVLNAFRHQRIKHEDEREHTRREKLACSTPFGINESNTQPG